MKVSEAAREFAIKAHYGQVRKSEPDKPMIIHPIGVAKILEEYGFDDHVIAAGYLHDVVEDTNYTIDYIKMYFGVDVANLVLSATEPDKSLSWEERKQHTINRTKDLPLRNKAVICADKINNLESLMILFDKTDIVDFSKFKRGIVEQKWYFSSVYESLINNENAEFPIFKRLKDTIDIVFNGKKDNYLNDVIFDDNLEYYKKLKRLHAAKLELEQLKSYVGLDRPFIIEFTGTPRTGKTTVINNLYDFFKKGGFDVAVVEEFTSSKYYKNILKKQFDTLSLESRNIKIMDYVLEKLLDISKSKNDIVIIDRSLSDRTIWNNIRCSKGELSESIYQKTLERYKVIAKELIDYLFLLYADSLTALKRDYNSSLALEPRSFLNTDNINDFNNSMNSLKPVFEETIDNVSIIDTTIHSVQDTSTEIASDLMPAIRKRYLDSFKNKYK